MHGCVSGGTKRETDVLLAYASQGQIAATHQTLGAGQQVANLRAQFAISRPTLAHGIGAEQSPGNVAMVSARLRCIERLQGVQMQQGSAGNSSGVHSRPFPLDGVGLHLVPAQSRTQVGIKRHGQAIRRTVHQRNGQRGPQAMRSMLNREAQLRARMYQTLTAGNLPEAEDRPSACIVRADRAYLQQRVSRCGPERVCLACIEPWVFGYFATPSGTLKRGFACRARRPGSPRGASGIPTPARNRPGPACRDTQLQRARARISRQSRDGSSLRWLPFEFAGGCHEWLRKMLPT